MNNIDMAKGILAKALNLIQDERMKIFIMDNLDFDPVDYDYLKGMLSEIDNGYNEYVVNGGDLGFSFDPRIKE